MSKVSRWVRALRDKEAELKNTKIWNHESLQREEIRGIFVLGILALIAVFRDELPTPSSTIGQAGSLQSTIFGVFVFWSLYVAFMILSISEDYLPKIMCLFFKGIGHLCLGLLSILWVWMVFLLFLPPLLSFGSWRS